ncbi:MAG: hypothetical protein JWO78_1887 [Micavibrio sp.]|nr:hypothetical protein [Micavibrio sp.]
MANNRVFRLVRDHDARGNADPRCTYLRDQHRNAVIYTNNEYGDKTYRRNFLRAAVENGFELWGGAHRVTMNDCGACRACVQVRIPVRDFPVPEGRLRVMQRHAAIRVTYNDTLTGDDQFGLYEVYQKSRFPLEVRLSRSEFKARMQEWQKMQVLQGPAGLAGVLYYEDCGSALIVGNNYYDRAPQAKQSYGTFAILSLVQMARARGDVDYIYLGPWAKGSGGLGYKGKFYPLDGYGGENWVLLDPVKDHATPPPDMGNIIRIALTP